ncbi:MAG TPA: MerR family transcriptional regulator [Bryobacteraceae bacterium]|nr:MerR family transcriptional regulator [Bryobacteraceae bacterium]
MSQIAGLREVPYLSTGQVAEILGITKKTLKNWLKASLIPEPQRNPMNRYRRWTLQDIESIRRIVTERDRG